jgi:hypothetical protein
MKDGVELHRSSLIRPLCIHAVISFYIAQAQADDKRNSCYGGSAQESYTPTKRDESPKSILCRWVSVLAGPLRREKDAFVDYFSSLLLRLMSCP